MPLLHDLINRVEGLATVHTMLTSKGWVPLNCTELCEKVIENVLKGVQATKKTKLFVTPSKATIGSDQAHHLTLVLNELATNSVKHASDKIITMEIDVRLTFDGKNLTLHYKDNGIGYPADMIDGDCGESNVGFDLIRGIVTQSLGGEFEIFNNNGANTLIQFEIEELA